MMKREDSKADVKAILQQWLDRAGKSQVQDLTHCESADASTRDEVEDAESGPKTDEVGGRYDFDLAEFPLFSL